MPGLTARIQPLWKGQSFTNCPLDLYKHSSIHVHVHTCNLRRFKMLYKVLKFNWQEETD